MFDDLIPATEAARQLHIKVNTLAIWRCKRRYPLAYIKIGLRVFYRQGEIDRFIQSGTHTSQPVEIRRRKH